MNPRFHPSLLTLDNAMEDFMQEWKQGLPVHPSGKERVSGGTCAGRHGNVDRVKHPNAHTGAETQAAQSVGSQSRFSFAGVIALLCVAAYVIWCVWQAVEQF